MKTIRVIEISIIVNEPIDLSNELLASGCLKMLRYEKKNVKIWTGKCNNITPHKSKTRETSFLEEKAFLVER